MPYTPHYRRQPEKPKRDWHDNVTLWVAVVGVVVITISPGISAWLGFLVRDQLIAMRDQQRVMESQQRPWIAIAKVKPIDVFVGIDFREGRVSVSPAITVTNAGQGVGTGVLVESRLIVAQPTGLDFEEVLITQTQICDELRLKAGDPRFLGEAVFPGQPMELLESVSADLESERIREIDGTKYIRLYLTGCIDYQFYVSPQRHQTRFTYDVVIRDGPAVFVPVDERASSRSVIYKRSTFGNGYAD